MALRSPSAEPQSRSREHTVDSIFIRREWNMAPRKSAQDQAVSRRDFLFAAAVGSGAVICGGLIASPAAASNKMSPKAMQYRPTPNGNQRCDNCANWQPPGQCKLVDGPIAASGWCMLYRPRK
jgi:hypothetical protein